MTIQEIIDRAGGARKIAEAITADRGDGGKEMKPDGVYKWPSIGIPDRHWPVIMSLVPELTAQTLFDANLQARGVAA